MGWVAAECLRIRSSVVTEPWYVGKKRQW